MSGLHYSAADQTLRKVAADYISTGRVTCRLGSEPVRPYHVLVSNDGATRSTEPLLYLPYNSLCHECVSDSDVGNCTRAVSPRGGGGGGRRGGCEQARIRGTVIVI